MRTVPTLYNNPHENPFSESINSFLQRQLTLDGNSLIVANFSDYSRIAASHAFYDQNGNAVVHEGMFDHNLQELKKDVNLLKSYLKLGFIAQSIENFETYLRKIIEKAIENKCTSKAIAVITNKSLRDNKARIKFLKSYCSALDTFLKTKKGKEQHDLYTFFELIRHIIVHQDQIIKPKDNINPNLNPFKIYFRQNDGRIILDGQISSVLTRISDFAYSIFYSLSIESNYPIDIR